MDKEIIFTTSWDDGDKLDLKLLKLMNKYGIKGTFYIPSNCDLSKKEIKLISKYQEIGAHTVNHKELDSISIEEAKKEIIESKFFLENILNKKIYSFCYPRGKYNLKVANEVKKAGFKYARTTNRFEFKLSKNPYLNGTSCQTILFKVDCFKFLKLNNFNPISIIYTFNLFYFLKNMVNLARKNGGILHLWGHSWEIEKYNQWDILESFFKYISNLKNVKFVTNIDLIKNEK